MSEKRYVIESQFDCGGFPCVVVFQRLGHRCGYVGVDKTHELYHVDYQAVEDLDCHGGLTYSGGPGYPVKGDYWWFGFDCAHYGDLPDYELAAGYFPDDPEVKLLKESPWRRFPTYDFEEIRSKEYVELECKKLTAQLATFKHEVRKEVKHGN